MSAVSRASGSVPQAWAYLVAAVGVPLAIFGVLAARAVADEQFGWEGSILDAVNAVAPVSSEEVHIDPVLHGATLGVALLTGAIGLALAWTSQWRGVVVLGVAIGGAVVASTIVKAVVKRPPIEGPSDGYSFPSGSATWSMATAVALVLLAPSVRARLVTAVLGGAFILAYGGIVVYEEWHYASDVLAAWCLALAWATAVWLLAGRPRAVVPARRAA
jgi:membrane-associated phospholipid phosphatase